MIIDTNLLIPLIKGEKKIIAELEDLVDEPSITLFNYVEMLSADLKEEDLQNLKDFLNSRFTILPLTLESSEIYTEKKKILKRKGRPVPDFALLIAAIALENDLVVVTMDKHFSMIPGLRCHQLNL